MALFQSVWLRDQQIDIFRSKFKIKVPAVARL